MHPCRAREGARGGEAGGEGGGGGGGPAGIRGAVVERTRQTIQKFAFKTPLSLPESASLPGARALAVSWALEEQIHGCLKPSLVATSARAAQHQP
jgi:hypothetical protein